MIILNAITDLIILIYATGFIAMFVSLAVYACSEESMQRRAQAQANDAFKNIAAVILVFAFAVAWPIVLVYTIRNAE